jgi:hypothetical protein
MMNLILLKTHPANLPKVVEVQKHALQGKLTRAKPGDLLLLAEIRPRGAARATHAMWFKEQRAAHQGETEEIWNERWPFIVEGQGCCALDQPFVPEDVKVSAANYSQGGTIFYIEPLDADAFRAQGRLKPLQ